MKTILLIGLGRYGRHIAKKLHELGHEVLGVDRNEEKVDLALPWLTRGLIADSTKLSFLESLSVRSFDLCIVAIGDDFQSSLETTSLLKDMGARMVVARAAKGLHEKFLLRNGADQVVYPAVYEIAVPAAWVGKTVGELDVRREWHINVLAVKKDGAVDAGILPSTRLEAGETILIIGKNDDIQKCLAL